jgi:hypothetical protein
VPLGWSGDGRAVVVGVAPRGEEARGASLEVVHDGFRVPLASGPGTFFLGFVRDVQ